MPKTRTGVPCPSCGFLLRETIAAGSCPACLMLQGESRPADVGWVAQCFPQLLDLRRLPSASTSDRTRVFEARDCETDEPVRLHLIPLPAEPSAAAARLAEIERRSVLAHGSVARILDSGETDGHVYVIESAPAGQSLREAVSQGELSRGDMLDILPRVTAVLQQASEAGVSLVFDPDSIFIDGDQKITIAGEFETKETGDPGSRMRWAEEHPAVGTRVGRYQLLARLGEGGFAEVYRAREEKPFRREVALKILKPGMDTKHILARFARERQALALMAHNGIARVFDAGATDSGRPYVAMELVEGEAITSFCDGRNLDIGKRVALLIEVCGAVQHAHGKGVIHRDLKPSNILVAEEDGVRLPKIIDFGIARAMDEPLAANTYFTRTQQFMGSPGYMSPEQVDGLGEIDARADVHALGAVLYELLTGEPPLPESAMPGLSLTEVIERIQLTPVEHPGDRVAGFETGRRTGLAQQRGVDDELAYRRVLAGPLADIALKALAKRPDARYPSAAAMAEDLAAWSSSQPVVARHRVRRGARRLRTALLGIAAVGVLAAALAIWQPWLKPEPPVAAAPSAYVPRSRLTDGQLRPVALFQFDGDLRSAIADGPAMVAWGEPELRYEEMEIGSEPAQVLHFPRFLPSQWLKFANPIGPNGPPGAEETNSWTLVFDLMCPRFNGSAALFQCHSENFGEAELYMAAEGIGSRFGLFYGELREREWYRIAVVSSHNGRSQLYSFHVNGTRWGIPWVKGMLDAGYAFDDEILLFCEGDQRTAEGFVNSVAMYDVPLSDEEIRTLGAATASGIPETFAPGPAQQDGEWLFAKRIEEPETQRNDRVGAALAAYRDELWSTAIYANSSAKNTGVVYQFARGENSNTWKKHGLLVPPAPAWPGMAFGKSCILSETFALIGAPDAGSSGACFLSRRSDSASPWGKLEPVELPAPVEGSRFGTCLAFAAPHTAAVGAPGIGSGGAIVLLDTDDGTATLLYNPVPAAAFDIGASVAAGDGVIIAGADYPPDSMTAAALTVFYLGVDGEWAAGVPIVPPPGAGQFGKTLTLEPNARRLAVSGGPADAVLIYEATPDSVWRETGRIAAPTSEHSALFGSALAWTERGVLAVGAPGASWQGRRCGIVQLFRAQADAGGENWELLRNIAPHIGSQEARFGSAIAIAGNSLWVGAPEDHTDRPSGGAVYFCELPMFESQRFETTSPIFTIGSAVAISGDLAAVGSPGIDARVTGGSLGIFRLGAAGRWIKEPPVQVPIELVTTGSFYHVALGQGQMATFLGDGLHFFASADKSWSSRTVFPREGSNFVAIDQATAVRTRSGAIEFFEHSPGGDWQSVEVLELEGCGNASPVTIANGIAACKAGPAIEVFAHSASGWEHMQQISSPGRSGGEGYFGNDLAIAEDILLIGSAAQDFQSSLPGGGRVKIYQRNAQAAGNFSLIAELTAPGEEEMPAFGSSVAISGDTILVGNPSIDRARAPGRVEVFRRSSTTGEWHHARTLAASNAETGDEFGIDVAIDGKHAVVGSKLNWVYFFDLEQR